VAFAALAAALFLVCCGRKADRGVETIVILPFENLAASPDFDWMGHGFSEALRLQLSGIPGRRPLAVAALRDTPATGPGRIVHGYFSVEGGRLSVHADVEDRATRRVVQTVAVTGPLAEGMLPLARAVAHRIDANARELPARNSDAFRAPRTANSIVPSRPTRISAPHIWPGRRFWRRAAIARAQCRCSRRRASTRRGSTDWNATGWN
jgi:hypothetical protein